MGGMVGMRRSGGWGGGDEEEWWEEVCVFLRWRVEG